MRRGWRVSRDLAAWARWLARVRRGTQGLAGLLLLGAAWQGWNVLHVQAAVLPQPPLLREAWFSPPAPVTAVRLDRLAPAPAAAPPPSAPAPLATGPAAPRLTLQGIVFSEAPRAYVVDDTSGQTVTVRPGDTLGAVTVTAIRERSVLIEQEGKTYELRL